MKLKFLLVPLAVLGFVVGSYADCSKDEILKFLDKGYSKAEVDGICGKKSTSKWINPTNNICKANGGKINNSGICKAKWSKAKDICRVSSARLPTIYELRKVIVDCGGIVDSKEDNYKNSFYRQCYQSKGFFLANIYWSSDARTLNGAWAVHFGYGQVLGVLNTNKQTIKCIKD